jgi:hypothetical protein
MFAGVLVLSLVGISLVFLYTSGPHFSTESSIHPLLGLITTILLVLQIILGFVIDALFDENRRSTPWYDVLHWWVGRLLSVLALATIVLGIVYFEKGYGESGMVMYITLAVFVAMGVGMMVYGQMNGGAKHHIKKE